MLGDGTRLNAKALKDLSSGEIVHVNLPGGGGYGEAFSRDVEKVRWDVIEGYITPEEAQEKYGVAVKYSGKADDLVRLPESGLSIKKRPPNCAGEEMHQSDFKGPNVGARPCACPQSGDHRGSPLQAISA